MSTTIVPCKFYRHPESRQTVGLHTSYVPPGYVLVTEGYTTKNEDGTSGCGKVPFKTEQEGIDWLAAYKARTGRDFKGMSAFTM